MVQTVFALPGRRDRMLGSFAMSRIAIAAAVLAFWVALGLIESGLFSSDPRGEGLTWALAWRYHMPAWIAFAALTPVVGVLARRFRITPERWLGSALVHLVAAMAFVVVHLLATNVMISLLTGANPFPIPFGISRVIARYLAVDLFFYIAIVAGFHVLHYYRESRERAIAASRLEASLAEARLQALRSQLEPHFLYNTLNAISTLAMRGDNQTVVTVVAHLGQLLRGTLDDGRPSEIPLAQELEILDPYLAIQRVRFGTRLTIAFDVPEDTRAALVPSLILQPLVENAVHHGIAAVDGGRIEIRAAHRGDRLALEIHDSGGHGAPSPGGNGVGLANTRARLAELYGTEQHFELAHVPEGGVVARVTLPWRVRRSAVVPLVNGIA